MILAKVDVGDFVSPQHHNERTRYLQPNVGDADSGNWDYTWWGNGSAAYCSAWICQPQRRSQPASVALTFAAGGWPANIAFPSVGMIKPDGFNISTNTTAAVSLNNIGVSGGYIVTY